MTTPISSRRESSDDTIDAAAALLLSDLPVSGIAQPNDAPDDLSKIRTIRHYLYNRRVRQKGDDDPFQRHPAWDMLLDLFASQTDEREASCFGLCVATVLPRDEAQMWLDAFAQAGIIEFYADTVIARQQNTRFTPSGLTRMDLWIARTMGRS